VSMMRPRLGQLLTRPGEAALNRHRPWWVDGVAAFVAQERPQNVHSSACEREDCLNVPFSLRSFPVVEGSRFGAALDADVGGHVEDALQATVVAPWTVQVAANTS
jgi:hypothetical protein